MKQLLSLFLFLLPCLAWAQYPSNGNQKITLGEQTTADGLIWRGVLGDTALITPLSDTSAYIILDTVNHRFYNYNRATNVWSVTTIGSISSGLTGVLPVANGGTGAASFSPNNYLIRTNSSGIFDTSAIYEAEGNVGIGTTTPNYLLDIWSNNQNIFNTLRLRNPYTGASDGSEILLGNSQNFTNAYFRLNGGGNNSQAGTGSLNIGVTQSSGLALYTANTNRLYITSSGLIGIGTTSPQTGYRLHVVDSVYVGGNVSASAYTTRSDYNLKDDIFDLKYGLNDILKLQPVEYTYKSNGSKQLGFIAQDIGTILPEVVSFEESMSVNYQAIIPILTKAIQEQQALIKALEQRIINLENK
jgi:hypothetical protein